MASIVENLLPWIPFDLCHKPPLIGDDYQVKIPPFSEGYWSRNLTDSENFALGIPFLKVQKIKLSISGTKVEGPLHISVRNGGLTRDSDEMDKCRNQDYFWVPELGSENYWSENQKDSFLLGLYTFGKNFIQVRKFVESKDMGAVLSFYYTKFYDFPEHRRYWSEYRKIKTRKVGGKKKISGLKVHELLSRTHPCVSRKCRIDLLVVDTSLSDGKLCQGRESRSSPFQFPKMLSQDGDQNRLEDAMSIDTSEIDNASLWTPKSNRELLQRNPKTCELVDLNLPPISLEIESVELDNQQADQMCFKQPDEQHPSTNLLRRKSTRNRLPTTRVLEALAIGFLTVKSGQKRNRKNTCGIRQPDEQRSSMNLLRRHSTRNWPPTTRALEALANGYLTVKSRQKRKCHKKCIKQPEEQQSCTNLLLRHSTRNRRPTTRVLEALANGYITEKSRLK